MTLQPYGSRDRFIIRRYQEGASLRQVAAEVGLSLEGTRRVLLNCGIERRPWGGRSPRPPMTEDQHNAAWQLYNRGYTQKDIADRLAAPVTHIRRFLHSRGAPRCRVATSIRQWTETEVDFVLAHRPDKSFAWIAQQLGRSRNSVIGLAHRLRMEEAERRARSPSKNTVLAG